MAKSIYKQFAGKSTEAWFRLTLEEQEKLLAKVNGALDQVGGKRILACDSSWSSEQWTFFGVEEFPDIEAVQKHSEILNELNWVRYVDTFTLIGTEWQF